MNLKVAVLGTNSHEAKVANVKLTKDMIEHQSGVDCEGDIFVLSASMDYASKLEHCRPYIRLIGEVHSLKGNFMHGVTEMEYIASHGYPSVEYRYNLTDDEISDLAKKGFFNSGYRMPDVFIENIFKLPLVCNISSIKDSKVPIMFIDIDNPFSMETDSEKSGYDITEYFEPLKSKTIDYSAEAEIEDEDSIKYGHVENMFAEQAAKEAEEEKQKLEAEKAKSFEDELNEQAAIVEEIHKDQPLLSDEEKFLAESAIRIAEESAKQYNERNSKRTDFTEENDMTPSSGNVKSESFEDENVFVDDFSNEYSIEQSSEDDTNDFEVASNGNGDDFVDDFSNEYEESDAFDIDSDSLSFEETMEEFSSFNEFNGDINEDDKFNKNAQTVKTALDVKEEIKKDENEHKETTYAPSFTPTIKPQSDSFDDEFGM